MKRCVSALFCLIATLPAFSQRHCQSAEYRAAQFKANPWLIGKAAAVTGGSPSDAGSLSNNSTPALITIPVIVHIVYHNPAENITDAQVQSQIDVLNADYQKRNADTMEIPHYYRSLAADCGFRFGLALLDTNSQPTTGIVRRYTDVPSFSINDDIKFAASGGDNGWDRDKYLNIWVGNLTNSLLGYSSIAGGPKSTDGVVVSYTAFGTNGTATAPFNRGRTATHEIGHWLNLIHTWGDDSCGNDEVADTPPQQAPDYGDPSGIVLTCGNEPYGNLYMDYMDFTDDIGMHLFTAGQRDRMRALFAPAGFRYPLLAANIPVAVPDTTARIDNPIRGITAWPNPAITAVTILLSDPSDVGGILEVFDQMGRRVTAIRITSPEMQVDVSGWSSGLYFIGINGSRISRTGKLLKL
ncbi:MAG TPA: M43 family zinc metalloprotease [Puia sp.]|nr:M43 family zinc metalloprotease [Puia sp.]